jgi:hypothetical protein
MSVQSVCLLLAVVVLGCSDTRPSLSDAGSAAPPDAQSEHCEDTTDPKTVDFFGEACDAQPFPINTTCHTEDRGWCIEGVCRPQCAVGCPRCPGGTAVLAPAGACYCTPRT